MENSMYSCNPRFTIYIYKLGLEVGGGGGGGVRQRDYNLSLLVRLID